MNVTTNETLQRLIFENLDWETEAYPDTNFSSPLEGDWWTVRENGVKVTFYFTPEQVQAAEEACKYNPAEALPWGDFENVSEVWLNGDVIEEMIFDQCEIGQMQFFELLPVGWGIDVMQIDDSTYAYRMTNQTASVNWVIGEVDGAAYQLIEITRHYAEYTETKLD